MEITEGHRINLGATDTNSLYSWLSPRIVLCLLVTFISLTGCQRKLNEESHISPTKSPPLQPSPKVLSTIDITPTPTSESSSYPNIWREVVDNQEYVVFAVEELPGSVEIVGLSENLGKVSFEFGNIVIRDPDGTIIHTSSKEELLADGNQEDPIYSVTLDIQLDPPIEIEGYTVDVAKFTIAFIVFDEDDRTLLYYIEPEEQQIILDNLLPSPSQTPGVPKGSDSLG